MRGFRQSGVLLHLRQFRLRGAAACQCGAGRGFELRCQLLGLLHGVPRAFVRAFSRGFIGCLLGGAGGGGSGFPRCAFRCGLRRLFVIDRR